MRKEIKYAAAFAIGAALYPLVEIAARGKTHWTMSLTGGACYLVIFGLGARLRRKNAFVRCAAGAFVITAFELGVGLVVNRALGWGVWDYSDRFANLWGQVCPLFTLYWFLLNLPLIPMTDALARFFAARERTENRLFPRYARLRTRD